MNLDLTKLDHNGEALLILLASIALGLLVDRLLIRRFFSAARHPHWTGIGIVVRSIEGLSFIWIVMLGIYMAIEEVALPAKVEADLVRAVSLVLIGTGALALSRMTVGAITRLARHGDHALPSTTIFANITRLFYAIVGLLVALDYLGIPITPILTALGVGGLAVALALQQTLANLFAGLQIVATRQLSLGDYVRLKDGTEGFVRDITWRSMVLQTVEGTTIIVPNSLMATTIFTNYSPTGAPAIARFKIIVAREANLEMLEKIVGEVYERIAGELEIEEGSPLIGYDEIGPTGVAVTVSLTDRKLADSPAARNAFIRALLERLREAHLVEEATPVPQPDITRLAG
jgi:small-conductance mechanosensitive channel